MMGEAERLGKRGEVVFIRTPDGSLYAMNKPVTSSQSSRMLSRTAGGRLIYDRGRRDCRSDLIVDERGGVTSQINT